MNDKARVFNKNEVNISLKNIYEFFYESYKKHSNSYYIFDKKYWSYSEIHEYVNYMTLFLLQKNIQVNDKIALYMENGVEYIVSYFAILRLGATVVPINPGAAEKNIIDILNDCSPALLLTTKNLLRKIDNLNFETRIPTELICKEKFDIKSNFDKTLDDFKFKTGKLSMIIYTSGTTDIPKGVMLTHKNLIINTDSILEYLQLNNTDSILATLFFGYSYGNSVFLTHTKAGALLFLHKAVYPQEVLNIVISKKITGFSTVGSYLNILLKQSNFSEKCFENLRYITLAGEPTTKSNLTKLQNTNKNLKIFVMYGQTEASARLTYLDPCMLSKKTNSVGKAIKNVEIKIVDEIGREIKNGEMGEIIAKGENIMQGYLNKPQETIKVLKNGWLYTGDLGYKDSVGYIYITGRKNDVIKYLGYRISPVEIENHINLDKNILESSAFEYFNGDNIEIAAAIVLKNNNFKLSDLLKTLRPNMSLYKIPKIFFMMDELPKTINGKLKRKEAKYIAEKSSIQLIEDVEGYKLVRLEVMIDAIQIS